MKNPLAFGYVLIGFIAGFGFGVITERLSALTFERLGFFFGIVVLIALWQWFEHASHRRNLEKWENIRSRGKWYFIAMRYLLTRAIIVMVLMLLPLWSVLKFSGYVLLALVLTYLIAILSLTFLGYQEWSTCEQEFEILSLRKAAERFRDQSSSSAKGGAAL
jgi:hypothetical protein